MSNPSTYSLSPSDYATQWCDVIIREKEECKRGVDFATKALTSQSAPDVINQCTDFSGTEAYRYGCYLTTVFSGSRENLCTTKLNDPQGKQISFAFPCANSCKTLFGSQGQSDTCISSAEYMFNQLVQNNGTCGTPAFSCVDALNQSGQSYNCANSKEDRTNVCLPSVVGCTLGGLESQFLGQVQQYQQSQSQTPVLSCQSFMYSNQPNSNPNGGGGGGNNPPQNWNPWPEGPTYVPDDGNGGDTGNTHNSNTFTL